MASEEIHTSAARIWLDDEGILNVVSIGVESTEESGREFFAAKRALLGDQRAALLLDARRWPGGSPASWVQLTQQLETISFAAAVVASPVSTERMGAFPDVFAGLLIPFRVFDEVEPAREFLRRNIAS